MPLASPHLPSFVDGTCGAPLTDELMRWEHVVPLSTLWKTLFVGRLPFAAHEPRSYLEASMKVAAGTQRSER